VLAVAGEKTGNKERDGKDERKGGKGVARGEGACTPNRRLSGFLRGKTGFTGT